MEYNFSKEDNKTLDEIIESRRSIRSFKGSLPPEENIKEIIRAGMLAPYATLLVNSKEDFRRFFVVKKGERRNEIASIMHNQVKNVYNGIKAKIGKDPQIKGKTQNLLKTLKARAENGIPNMEDAPYFIIIAEAKGPIPVEMESIAHSLQNMWLKTTALGLGFQLISATEQIAQNEEFCKILGIPPKKYGLNGCLIGYPQKIPAVTSRPDPEESPKWIE
ncbi:MAG: nitroreductase family protein [Methanobacterium sp.]